MKKLIVRIIYRMVLKVLEEVLVDLDENGIPDILEMEKVKEGEFGS